MDTATRTAAEVDAVLGRYHPEDHPPGYRAAWYDKRDDLRALPEDTAAIVVGSRWVRLAALVTA